MWLFKWFGLLLALSVAFSRVAYGVPLDSWSTWSTAQPYASKQVPPNSLVVRGTGTNAYYVLEADVTTGALPVNVAGGSFAVNYSGVPGAATPSNAAFVGGTDGTLLRGIKTDTAGELQVDVLSSALPAGAATQTTLATIAADIADIATFTTPKVYSDSAYYDYSGGSVTTAAWTQVIASTAADISLLCVTDTSGQVMQIGSGAAAAETRVFLIARGSSACIPLFIMAGTRISVRAVSATASTGELVLSGMN